jgi:hypothetical protein
VHLYSQTFEAEFVQKLLWDENKELAMPFKHTYRYNDDVLSINDHNFHNIHLIYSDELEMKDTTKSDKSSNLDILLNMDCNYTMTNVMIFTF